VIAAFAAGQHLFGENRVQEAAAKFAPIIPAGSHDDSSRDPYGRCMQRPDDPAEFAVAPPGTAVHIIGTLQRNKVKTAVAIAACLEAIDRLEVLLEADKQAAALHRTIDVMLELHTGESSKSGFPTPDALFAALDAASALKNVRPVGLMTMAPFTTDEKLIRRSFVALRNALEACQTRFPALPLTELSMGMSNDYKLAIAEGSTLVRIGTAIFGPRPEAPS
jgi:pyridoxal phosphate enzyme (YggS family)